MTSVFQKIYNNLQKNNNDIKQFCKTVMTTNYLNKIIPKMLILLKKISVYPYNNYPVYVKVNLNILT